MKRRVFQLRGCVDRRRRPLKRAVGDVARKSGPTVAAGGRCHFAFGVLYRIEQLTDRRIEFITFSAYDSNADQSGARAAGVCESVRLL